MCESSRAFYFISQNISSTLNVHFPPYIFNSPNKWQQQRSHTRQEYGQFDLSVNKNICSLCRCAPMVEAEAIVFTGDASKYCCLAIIDSVAFFNEYIHNVELDC